jgi:hypothetical protein
MIPVMDSDYCRNTWVMLASIQPQNIEKSQALNIVHGMTIFGTVAPKP